MGSMGSMTSLDKVVNTLQGSPQQRPTKFEEKIVWHNQSLWKWLLIKAQQTRGWSYKEYNTSPKTIKYKN